MTILVISPETSAPTPGPFLLTYLYVSIRDRLPARDSCTLSRRVHTGPRPSQTTLRDWDGEQKGGLCVCVYMRVYACVCVNAETNVPEGAAGRGARLWIPRQAFYICA